MVLCQWANYVLGPEICELFWLPLEWTWLVYWTHVNLLRLFSFRSNFNRSGRWSLIFIGCRRYKVHGRCYNVWNTWVVVAVFYFCGGGGRWFWVKLQSSKFFLPFHSIAPHHHFSGVSSLFFSLLTIVSPQVTFFNDFCWKEQCSTSSYYVPHQLYVCNSSNARVDPIFIFCACVILMPPYLVNALLFIWVMIFWLSCCDTIYLFDH